MKFTGLTDREVEESRAKYGTNALTEKKQETFWQKLLSNMTDPMIKILFAALILNTIFVCLGQAEWYETVGIAVAIFLAVFVSTYSEFRNENAFKQLQEEASRITCKVWRNGTITEVSINDLVKDDCVLLQAGDRIPADGVMVKGCLKADQSALNGEAQEATKEAAPDDWQKTTDTVADTLDPFLVFRGAIVCSGEGVMKITGIGDDSEYGRIASELQQTEERDSPLKVKLKKLAKQISWFGYLGGVAIACAYVIHKVMVFNGTFVAYASSEMIIDILHAVMFAVTIIVMAVPEGLPLMIALVSALNMRKMLKDNVLVRTISGIETAGSLNILYSDKTGTITKGKFEVTSVTDGAGHEYANKSEIPAAIKNLADASVFLNTQSKLSAQGSGFKVIGGNATERAVLAFAASDGRKEYNCETVRTAPFNSTNKYSAATVKGDFNTTFVKGAAEKITALCNGYYDANGQRVPCTDFSALCAKMEALASRAIRLLALATVSSSINEDESLPQDGEWTLIAVLGIRDEVRPEACVAIDDVTKAGIQVVMISGDRLETAAAIARDAGIVKHDTDKLLTSADLGKLSDDELKAMIPNLRVIARALPTDKSRMVRLSQELDLVAGMTGDGVNDSPALKKADVGFGMGAGTEVAKEASDVVVLDDNFTSVRKAVLYGRTIYNNIRKFIVFQLTVNVAAVMTSFLMPLLGRDMPLNIVQILWINLIMDTLAAIALGSEPALNRYMHEKPKTRTESIIGKGMLIQVLSGAAWIFGVGIILLFCQPVQDYLFSFGSVAGGTEEQQILTMFFTLFIFMVVFNSFNARTTSTNVFECINQNKMFFGVLALIVVIHVFMTEVGVFFPIFGKIFNCHGLTIEQWLIITAIAFTIIPFDIVRKLIANIINGKNA